MRAWVFTEDQLDSMLAAREAARQKQDGATEQQAKDETSAIKIFLVDAELLQLRQIRSEQEIRAEIARQMRL